MKKATVFFALFFGIQTLISQELQDSTMTICWDTSLSMQDRNMEKDLSVLEKYFVKNKNQKVQVLFFDLGLREKEFTVTQGDWQELRAALTAATYDGASLFTDLEKSIKYKRVYVFTDGKGFDKKAVIAMPKGSYIINSSPMRDGEFLKRNALITRSRLVDFTATMAQNLKTTLPHKNIENAQQIKGTVYIDNRPASNVKVAIKGISDSFLTDSDGNFSLLGRTGDSLLITSRENNTLRIVPIEPNIQMKIFMAPNTVALDEVVLVEQAQEVEKSTTTGYGLESEEKLGYAVQSIGDDAISPIQTNVASSVQNRFSGVNVARNNDLSQVNMRTDNSMLLNNYGLIVIDGVPVQRSNSSASNGSLANFSYVDPENIADITVLKGYAATNRYGTLGSGGVLLITTKTGDYGKAERKGNDLARLKNNIYDEESSIGSIKGSSFLEILQNSVSEKEAYGNYLSLRRKYPTNVLLYLDAFSYFEVRNPELALRILYNIQEVYPNDTAKLTSLALVLSTIGKYQEVLNLYEKIKELLPNAVQPYLNMALTKVRMGQYQNGLNDMLALSSSNKYPGLRTSGISKTLGREIRRLLFHHKEDLDASKVDHKYLNNVTYKARLVFEWNRPNTEFEIQFVNPQNRFFNWEYTDSANRNRINEGIADGYAMEEFELTGDMKGKWIVNATYLEDHPLKESLVLKCTLYKDFGTSKEIREDTWMHFDAVGQKKNIWTLHLK
ncbi:MAG: TonB-dependent receptor plug domain-containing protein [Saonia sp.]